MKQSFKRSIALMLSFMMVVGVFASMPFEAFAVGVDYDLNASVSTDKYYNIISKKDWDNALGITESEIVLNNDAGDYRQVVHIMKADVNNSYVSIIPTYSEMNTSKYQTGTMLDQANWIDKNMDGEVIGVMNCCLSWYTGYPAERVGEPLGFMMLNGEIMFDPGNCGYNYGNVGFPTCVVINKDINAAGEVRPTNIPKLEMVQIRTSADLDGWEDTVIPISSGYIVKDGVNQSKASHKDNPAPRSVVGITTDGQVVIMLNDGRQEPYSAGMNMYECAEVMIAAGCVWAANCDGGGSSTFVSQRPGEELQVVNSPSDGGLRPSTSGICFISTAPSNGEFARANISTEYNYYTPGSVVEFTATGADFAGGAAEIPDDAIWQLSDSSYGTISDGWFESNGKIGEVTAQLVYNGEVKGEKTIQIVWPTDFSFASAAMTVPFGKTVSIEFVATYNGPESYVATKNGDIEFVLSQPSLGIIDGLAFIANSDENAAITTGTLTATINGLSSEITINLGKGAEVIFDFESQDDENEWYLLDYNVYTTTTTSQKDVLIEDAVQIVTPQNGKVHSGDSAMAVTLDYSDGSSGGWTQFRLVYNGDYFEIANAKKLGFWIWMPDEAYANELDLCLAYIDANGNLAKGSPVLTDIAYCVTEQDEAGWRYFTTDISAHPIFYLGKHEDQTNFSRRFYIQFYNYTNQWQNDNAVVNTNGKFTYFIDDITIEYSDAVDDSEAPVFGTMSLVDPNGIASEMNGQIIRYNTIGAEVSVSDFVKNNASGINAASAKAYVDGVEVECAYAGGRISISDISLADGLHTVKFEICDNIGNLNSIIRQFTVDADSGIPTVTLVPNDGNLTNLPMGSVYYVDLVATNIEGVNKITVDLDLINTFDWELAYADVAEGFEISYLIDTYTNVATITISRTGDVLLSGEQVIASIPVRVWSPKVDRGTRNSTYLTEVYLSIKCLYGSLECKDGTVSTFTCAPITVASEMWMNQWNRPNGFAGITLHKHTAQAIDDKDATCTNNGYIGRTYCEQCSSVVDWGTVFSAIGHSYGVNDEGKLACVNGRELFTGVYIDGKTYVDGVVVTDGWNGNYYYKDGKKVTGPVVIDKIVYVFDDDGVYQFDKTYNGFINSDDGVMYFYSNTNFEESYLFIDNTAYYFTDGIAKNGVYTINDELCLFKDGAYVSCSTSSVMDAGWQGLTVTYIIYSDGSMILGGEGATYKYTSRAQLPWYNIRTDITSITIGRDITSLDQFALADIYYANTITFEEDSRLEYIGAAAFLSNYKITRIILPDSLKTIVQNAFKMCKNLSDVYLPLGIKYINKLSFVNNKNIVMDDIHFHVYADTYAENYAKEYNIPYTLREFIDFEVASGICGENATWTLYESGKMAIDGSGAMYDYTDKTTTPWAEYLQKITSVVIGNEITRVGNFAFAYGHNIKSVTFEEGSKLETVGAASFMYMLYTSEVILPETVTTIGNNAFSYSSHLENIVIPQNVKLIYVRSFYSCKSLVLNVAADTYGEQYAQTNGIAYKTREYIDSIVASGICGENATWTLYESGKMAIDGSGAMYDYTDKTTTPWAEYLQKITSVVIGNEITRVGNFAFAYGHNIKSVTFEEGSKLETVGAASFMYMLYTSEVILPETVTTIGNNAFSYSSRLANVVIPQNVVMIYTRSFYGCKNLRLTVASGSYAEEYAIENNIAYLVK